jgi:tetratricopeptide (TPR) repeat protein
MKLRFFLMALLAFAGLARAADAPNPWSAAQAVLDATQADFMKDGLRAVEPHVADLEQALAHADEIKPADDGTVYILTDGQADTVAALAGALMVKGKTDAKVVAIANPYPAISLYLGSYYNEIGKPEDALRVLDRGLALLGDDMRAEHRSYLVGERGAALLALKRWQDALDNYQGGLKLEGLDDKTKARLHRGCGFALTELGKLDDAEAQYKTSLDLDPGNAIAIGELEYIAHLRAGGDKAPTTLTLPNQ